MAFPVFVYRLSLTDPTVAYLGFISIFLKDQVNLLNHCKISQDEKSYKVCNHHIVIHVGDVL